MTADLILLFLDTWGRISVEGSPCQNRLEGRAGFSDCDSWAGVRRRVCSTFLEQSCANGKVQCGWHSGGKLHHRQNLSCKGEAETCRPCGKWLFAQQVRSGKGLWQSVGLIQHRKVAKQPP